MKKITRSWLIALAVLSLTGCMEVETLIKVRPDGSGTVEETVLLRKDAAEQMKRMAEQMANMMAGKEEGGGAPKEKGGKGKEEAKEFELFPEEQMKKRAAAMGEGVTYLSGEKVSTETGEGYRAIYAFTDIEKLLINQNPSDKMPSGPTVPDAPPGGGEGSSAGPSEESGEKSGKEEKKEEFVRFGFKKGKPSVLIITMPKKEFEPEDEEKTEEKPEGSEGGKETGPDDNQKRDMAELMMREMFRGMKISIAVEVEGSIVETDATHRDGSRVTLMEIEFGKLLESVEEFEKFVAAKPRTLEESKEILKLIPGIRLEMNGEVTIGFE
ncbi:MAG: hypothetical protein V3W31_03500 [Thermodesulfobacteriota bacterium]